MNPCNEAGYPFKGVACAINPDEIFSTPFDVMVEATGSPTSASAHALEAIMRGIHVVM